MNVYSFFTSAFRYSSYYFRFRRVKDEEIAQLQAVVSELKESSRAKVGEIDSQLAEARKAHDRLNEEHRQTIASMQQHLQV